MREIPENEDPILELVPILKNAGYALVANGVSGDDRFLLFRETLDRDA